MKPTDGELIELFLKNQDEVCFESLVQRYGGMVLNLCRQILVNSQDAEDAFQATFLVLAQKAGSVRKKDSLGSWLYGVALRTALRQKTKSNQRNLQEMEAATMQNLQTNPKNAQAESWSILHHELGQLPEKYSQPIILCYLNGKTYEEAAEELGWTYDETRGKLERGRDLLRDRLEKRGLALTALALTTALSQHSAMAVPLALSGTTIKAAVGVVTGKVAAAGVVASPSASLAREVIQGIFMQKIKIAAIGTVSVLLMAGSVGVGIVQTQKTHQVYLKNQKLVQQSEELMKGNTVLKEKLSQSEDSFKQLEQESAKWKTGVREYQKTLTSNDVLSGKGNASSDPSTSKGKKQSLGNMVSEMFNDPHMREAMITAVENVYMPLFEKLGLTQEKRKAVLEAMLPMSFESMNLFKTGNFEKLQEENKRVESKIKILLGEEGFKEYKIYSSTLTLRTLANQLKTSLIYSSTPLRDDQSDRLLKMIYNEGESHPEAISVQGFNDSAMADWTRLQNEQFQRILNQSSAVLLPEQQKKLAELFSHQVEQAVAGAKMAHQLFQSKGEDAR